MQPLAEDQTITRVVLVLLGYFINLPNSPKTLPPTSLLKTYANRDDP